MRLVLVLLLIHGLVPALGEVAETVVHYLDEGHLAHSTADRGDLGEQGDEHGCGTTQHQCDCCASQAVGLPANGPALLLAAATRAGHPAERRLLSLHAPAPLHRPPIPA